MKPAVAVLVGWLVLLAGAPAARQAPAPQLPTFRTGVDAVQIDVSVRVEDVLRATAAYIAGYERRLAVVGQEDYVQQAANVPPRRLRSDILFIQDDDFGWVEYRDVAERDGTAVRDREARLLALFTKPNPDRIKQAQRIVAEGARFNVNPPGALINRTLNLPLTALRFLRAGDQSRSSFRVAAWDPQTGAVALEFTEQHRPRLIGTQDQQAAHGRFDIDRATGRVTTSSLTLKSGTTLATFLVKFSPNGNIGMWLPLAMEEEYRGTFKGVLIGRASYAQYRQFRVETSTDIKH